METVYCNIFEQKINENKCYLKKEPLEYSKNSYCQACPKYKDFAPKAFPDKLLNFLEKEFQSMLRFEKKHKEDRKVVRSKLKRKDGRPAIQACRESKKEK